MTEWVCGECGLDYGTLTVASSADRVRPFPARWRSTIGALDEASLRRRPEPATWSPIEYAAHVRDVTDWLASLLVAMAAGEPLPAMVDPDEQAEAEGYATAAAPDVLDGIDAATDRLVGFLDGLTVEVAEVTAEFPWGTRRVLDMARNAVHEHTHHLFDVARQLGAGGTGPDPA